MICIRLGLLRHLASSVLLWLGSLAAMIFLLAASLAAQEQSPPAATPVPKAAATTPAPAAQDSSLASVLVESAKVRCFAGDLSPSFEDVLQTGAVVGIGRVEGNYRQILLPLGPVGFVSKKFASAPTDGTVTAQGRGVSFRYRPKAEEAPAAVLEDKAELHLVGDAGDWWKVRAPAVETWLLAAEIQVFDQPAETMRLAFAELEKVHRGEVAEYQAKVAEAAAAAKQAQADQAALLALRQRVHGEMQKPVGAQDYSAVEQELTALASALPEDSPLRNDIGVMQKRIHDRKWVVEATAVRNDPPPPPKDLPVMPAETRDPLERFDATGWLRYHSILGRPGYFTIEKGKQVLYHVTCTNQRYDLSLFLDKEVGLVGPRRRPATESLRVLDVEKIEVLGIPIASR